jgi:predicted dehydrogenase
MADDVIGVGVSGLGRAGRDLHIKTIRDLTERFAVTAVHDPIEERLTEVSEFTGARAHRTFAGLANDPAVDLVLIASPSYLHRQQACEALAAGKHVLVEKPIATSIGDAEAIYAAARVAGKRVIVAHNLRFQRTFRTICDVLLAGTIGDIVAVNVRWHFFRRRWDWQTLNAQGGGVLNNDGSHVIDQVLTLFPYTFTDITCYLRRSPLTAGDAEDHVKILLGGRGLPLVDIELTNASAFPQPVWHVMGTAGGLVADRRSVTWRYIDPGQLEPRTASQEPTPDRSYNSEELEWFEESVVSEGDEYSDSLRQMYLQIWRLLSSGEGNVASEESVLEQLRILTECQSRTVEVYRMASFGEGGLERRDQHSVSARQTLSNSARSGSTHRHLDEW